jgi:quercetin dioxygenase-like cupin family protein
VQAWRTEDLALEEAWIEGEDTARWASATAHGEGTGAAGSCSSILEVPPGCRLPRHTDSAEETIVVLSGAATVEVDGEETPVEPGGERERNSTA